MPYCIVELTAPTQVLRQRILNRKNDVSDADLTVLEHQIKNWSVLHKDELHHAVTINTEQHPDINTLIKKINR